MLDVDNTEEYLRLQNIFQSIITKFISKIGGESQKQSWTAHFNQLLPQKTLGYASIEEYLADNNLTPDEIIKNSIDFSKANISDDDKNDLAVFLKPFASISKIIIYEIDGKSTPIYIDILNVLAYIKNIQEILDKFPINFNDYDGTAHRASSYKQLLKTQINKLADRLNDPYFPIEDEAAIEIIETQIKALKLVESGKFAVFPEFINLGEILFGLESKTFELSANELKAFRQLLNFFNGLKTNKEELVRSVMIYLGIYLSNYDDKEIAAQTVLNIIMVFFPVILKKCENSDKNYLYYTSKHLEKPIAVKTIFNKTPIYCYQYAKSQDLLMVYAKIFVMGSSELLEFQTNDIRFSELNVDVENSYKRTRRVVEACKAFEYTKEEIRTLIKYSPKSNQQEGNFPSA